MTNNISGMKKIISVVLLGSLLATGAVVYADTLSATGTSMIKHMEQRGGHGAGMLSGLVTAGIITADEQATVEKAMITQHEAMKAASSESKTLPAAGTEKLSPFGRMAEKGLISKALAEKIDTYMTNQRDAAFAAEVKPLVDAGTFADTSAVKTAMDAVRDTMMAKMDALKPSAEREKVDFSSMTDAERTAFKEKTDAERTVIQEKRDAAVKEVYSSLVSAGTLTQAQADGLQSLVKNREPGDRGHSPGFGGKGPHKEAPVKTSDVAE